MKKFYSIAALIFTVFIGNAQTIIFTDNVFKQKLLQSGHGLMVARNLSKSYFAVDANGDNQISVQEASRVSWLKLDDTYSTSIISSMNEISNFVNLKYLNSDDNNVTQLNLT